MVDTITTMDKKRLLELENENLENRLEIMALRAVMEREGLVDKKEEQF